MNIRRVIVGLVFPLLIGGGLFMLASESAVAAATVPQRIPYAGYLLTGGGSPLSGPYRLRFSYWNTADALSSDRTASGAINTDAAGYLGWQETDVVTLGNKGSFTVFLGSGTTLPDFSTFRAADLRSLHLQVEVRTIYSTDADYELLDPNPGDPTIDRSAALPAFSAINADLVDGHDIGTGSGSIPMLGSGGVLSKARIPSGTNANTFTIDAGNSAGSTINLKFGESLNKVLSYDKVNSWFNFNASVRIQGNLILNGLVNGVDVTNLVPSTYTPLRVASGAGLHVDVSPGNYRVNGNVVNFSGAGLDVPNDTNSYVFFSSTGALLNRSAFPTNQSFIPLATVTTISGNITTVTDKRVLQSDDREHSILDVLHPGYPSSAYDADGSSNVGQLSVDHDGTSKNNFYQWTTSKAALNDYDIVVRYTLPQKFIRWQTTPFKLYYRTSSADAAVSKADIEVYDTAGNAVTLVGTSTNLTSTSWTSTSLTFGGSPAWTAGQTFIIKIRSSAKNAATVHIGDLELSTVELQKQ